MRRFLLLGAISVSTLIPVFFGGCGSDNGPADAGIDVGKEIYIPPPQDHWVDPESGPVPVKVAMQVFERTKSGQVIVGVDVCVLDHTEILCAQTNSNGRIDMEVPRLELTFGFKKDTYAAFAYPVDTRSLPPGLFSVVMATQAELSSALGSAYDINGAHVLAYLANVNQPPQFNMVIDPPGGQSAALLQNINMRGFTSVTAGDVKVTFSAIPIEGGTIDAGIDASGLDASLDASLDGDADPPEADPPDAGTCGPPKAGVVGWDENMQVNEIRGKAYSGYATMFNVVCQ